MAARARYHLLISRPLPFSTCMRPVYAVAANITCPMGLDTGAVWEGVAAGKKGLRQHEDAALSHVPFWGSRLEAAQWQVIRNRVGNAASLSPFEQLCLFSAREAMSQLDSAPDLSRTGLVLSSTKGNIEWLGTEPDERNALSTSADLLAKALGIPQASVVSHACISGVVALLYGLRMLQAGRMDHVVVIGADRFTKFVLNGFQSFQAVADGPCRPFDAARKGVNLGEAAATIILSRNPGDDPLARLYSGATSNDANHISGPSRTGAELALAIDRALKEAVVDKAQIGMISSHGTATLYNDEMEAKAFALAGLLHSPVHSMKGYVGHTLGGAGVLESAMILESLRRQLLIPSAGYEQSGVSEPLRITTRMESAPIDYVLKTASGFGGCNAAMVWGRA